MANTERQIIIRRQNKDDGSGTYMTLPFLCTQLTADELIALYKAVQGRVNDTPAVAFFAAAKKNAEGFAKLLADLLEPRLYKDEPFCMRNAVRVDLGDEICEFLDACMLPRCKRNVLKTAGWSTFVDEINCP